MTSAHAMDDLAGQLNNSGSATIYVDIAGISQDTTTVSGGLHISFDEVRQLFAVRKATDEEVAEAEASSSSTAPKTTASKSSGTAASNSA